MAADVKLLLSVRSSWAHRQNGNVLRECNITLKDCRIWTLKRIPSVASHLPKFYLWCSRRRRKKKVHVPTKRYTFSWLWLRSYLSGREKIPEPSSGEKKGGGLGVRMQRSISITDSVAIDSEWACARRGADTTDPVVWELSIKGIQESPSEPVRVKRTASHSSHTREHCGGEGSA